MQFQVKRLRLDYETRRRRQDFQGGRTQQVCFAEASCQSGLSSLLRQAIGEECVAQDRQEQACIIVVV